MTILLTLAVYSVRISSDFPTQSLYLPYVSVYFTIGYLHTFSTLLWLCVQSYMIERKIMFWWVFYIAYFQSKIDLFFTILVRLFKSLKKTKKQEPKVGLDPVPMKQVCNKCDMCINCLKDKNKVKENEDSLKFLKFRCEQVNIVVFSTIFLSTLISYTAIWTTIAYNQIY